MDTPSQNHHTSDTPIVIAEPMLGFACNLKGCCCQGWTIPFKTSGLTRLTTAFPEEERNQRLGWGLRLAIDPDQEHVKHIELDGVGPQKACRFLEQEGTCEVHRRFGTDALPDLCVTFPFIAFQSHRGVELHYEALCPSVLDQLAHDERPYLPTVLSATDHPGLATRARSPHPALRIQLGELSLHSGDMEPVRASILEALSDVHRPAIEHLSAISHALNKIKTPEDIQAFEISYEDPPEPFFDFLEDCVWSNSPQVLTIMWKRYKRFVWSLDREDERLSALAHHLEHWGEPLQTYMAPAEEALRPLLVRYLAHRYYSLFTRVQGKLLFTYGSVPHVYALSIRMAAALSGALERTTDLGIMKAAIGFADYVYRGLPIPPEGLPWFGASGSTGGRRSREGLLPPEDKM